MSIFRYFDFGQSVRNISIKMKIWEKLDFIKNIRKISISVKFFENQSKIYLNIDFGKIFRKSRFWL